MMDFATSQAPARELDVDEKLMFAAANVLAGTSGISNGHVVVIDADHARFRLGLPDEPEDTYEVITFKRAQACIYEMDVTTMGSADNQRQMVDFGRLTGRWRESGKELALLSNGDSHCFQNSSREACWPGYVFLPYSNISHQRIVDDATFLIKNGCGMSATGDPY